MSGTGVKLDPPPQSQSPIAVELANEQFKPLFDKLQEKTPKDKLDTWNKRLDILQKLVVIGATIGAALTIWLNWQTFKTSKTESQAKSFAGLFAAEPEKRLEAAVAAANNLDEKELAEFVKFALARFDDPLPKSRELAQEGIITMAATSYDRGKVPIIVDVLAEALNTARDEAKQERAAATVGKIGLPTQKFLSAANTVLTKRADGEMDKKKKVLISTCNAIKNLDWPDSSRQTFSEERRILRATLKGIVDDRRISEEVQDACRGALD